MKKLKIIFLSVIIIFILPINTFAQEAIEDDTYTKLYEQSGAEDIQNALPNEVKEILREIGIENVSFDSIFKADFKSLFKLFYEISCKNIDRPLKLLFKITGILILTSIVKILLPSDNRLNDTVNMVLGCVIVLCVFSSLSDSLTRGVTAIESSCVFMKALIPVFAGIISMSGNPLLALSYNSLTLFMAEGVSSLCKNTVVPLSGAYTALCAVSAISSEINLKGMTDLIKKTSMTVLSVGAAIFSAALTLKGLMAGAADSLMSRGIKLAISSAIPVVGGALSEAYSSIIGSLALLKSAVGMFCILAVLFINLPVVIELTSFIICFKATGALASLLDNQSGEKIIESITSTFTIINITVIFESVIFIISSAIILSLRTLI